MRKGTTKRVAYTTVEVSHGRFGIACCVEGEKGYHPVPDYGPYDDEKRAELIARNLNTRLAHVTPKEALRIVLSTMKRAPSRRRAVHV